MLDAAGRARLIRTALGTDAPDCALVGGTIANVLTRELHPGDILIRDGRIAAVLEPGSRSFDPATEVLDVTGRIITPGFIDPHVHVESSMVTVAEYSRAVVPRGVTTIAADPHEIGNVLGLPGMRLLFDEARTVPLKLLLRVPGRIPAMPDWLETSNARLDVAETQDMLAWEEAVCLAGDINPALILQADPEQLAKIAFFQAHHRAISGQAPGLHGARLNAFIAGGPGDSHVAANLDEILENQRLGLRSVLALRPGRRLGRADFRALAERVREGLETRYLQFCTDDIHAHFLHNEGSLDHRLRMLIEEGFDPLVALQMVTVNVAEALRIDQEYGSVTPGRYADLVVLGDLRSVAIERVLINGRIVFDADGYHAPPGGFVYPEWAKQTIRLAGPAVAADFMVQVPHNSHRARVRAISIASPKQGVDVVLDVAGGIVQPDPAQDIASLGVMDRHTASGRVGRGFMTGLGLQRGALAASVSHDAHNLFVIGQSFTDMALAANRLAEIGGGYAVALEGAVIFELPLPIAGLMSEAPLAVVAAQMAALEQLLTKRLGCQSSGRALMALNFLCLPNLPHYGFTDFGLIDTHALAAVDTVLDAGP